MDYWYSIFPGKVIIHVFIKYIIKPIPVSQLWGLFPFAAPDTVLSSILVRRHKIYSKLFKNSIKGLFSEVYEGLRELSAVSETRIHYNF